MAVVDRPTKKGTVYYVVTRGKATRVGFNRREAERLDARDKAAIKAGTWSREGDPRMAVGTYLKSWLDGLDKRSADLDRMMIERHVLGIGEDAPPERKWFTKLRLDDLEPKHSQRLAEELNASVGSRKYASNIYGAVRAALRAAVRRGLLLRDVCLLDPGTLSRKTKKREPYPLDDVRLVLGAADNHRLVWIAKAFFTGGREGEICGLTWADWDPKSEPLGALTIDKQYDGQPLKGDDDETARPRRVPVHPDLELVLHWWQAVGFELVYCRKPLPNDYIVPRTDADSLPQSKSSAYKAFQKVLKAAGVRNRTLHSTRHTFITEIQRGGANQKVVERITHNAVGEMIDQYTHWAWEPLCEAVLCLPDLLPDSCRDALLARVDPEKLSSGARTRTRTTATKSAQKRESSENDAASGPPKTRTARKLGAGLEARQEFGREPDEPAFVAAVREHEERARAVAVHVEPLPGLVKIRLIERLRAGRSA